VDHACELHAGDVPGRGGLSCKVPGGLICVRELFREETAAVLLCRDTGIALTLAGERPRVFLRNGANIEDVHDQEVARFGAFDGKWARERVDVVERGVEDVLG